MTRNRLTDEDKDLIRSEARVVAKERRYGFARWMVRLLTLAG